MIIRQDRRQKQIKARKMAELSWTELMNHLVVAGKEIRAEERERCAKIADERARIWRHQPVPLESKATEAEAIAAEIRNTN